MLQKEKYQKVKKIFNEVLDQREEDRADFLRSICENDADLFAEVESLLSVNVNSGSLLEDNKLNFESITKTEEKKYSGKTFGHYKIIREIGRGGMGAVFLAERDDGEFHQQTALKIVRQTIVDSELARRFKQERQILASLNHPNIAKLLDGGVSAEGEPYLVMEYVEGLPLMDYAESQNLKIEGRLDLFVKICSAVSYAHRNLVIHRDIKPSNIIVTKDGEPKLLDFGLAKFLDSEVFGQDSTDTATQLRAFTLAYASPEQIRGGQVTTASDVYSLSVVLYELLSGARPFHFENKSLDEILNSVGNSQAQKPSEVISEKANSAPATNPKLLKGDLDNICLMGLRSEPERRYQSAGHLSEDIKRHLKGLPILARPQTFIYQASKFFKRNKAAVSAAALIIVAIIGGGLISLIQYRQNERERVKTEEVKNFLQKMLLTADPNATDYSTSVNDMLENATKRIEKEDLSNQPEVKAELQQIIGSIYLNQGKYELSEKYLLAALATQIKLYGDDNNKVLLTRITLGNLYFTKAEYDEADKIYKQFLPAFREETIREKFDISILINTLSNYALLYRARGDSIQAEKLFRESLNLAQNSPSHQDVNNIQTLLSLTLLDQGKFDEAETNVRNLVSESRRSAQNDTLDLGNSLTLLGSILMEKGDLNEAKSCLSEAENIYKKLLSANSLAVHDNIRLQAQVSYLAGNYADAENQIRQVLENYSQNSNPKYISFATALTVQGLILNKLGKREEAEKVLREAVRLRVENLPPTHFMTALTKGALGEILATEKKFDEAEPFLRESYDELVSLQASENRRVLTAKRRLDDLYREWKK